MAFSNISDQQLGNFLQIAFSDGVRNQISDDFRDYEAIKRSRVADPMGREIRFLFQSSYGPAAVQYRNPGVPSVFPREQQGAVSEHTAVFKELYSTVQLEYNLWERLRLSPNVRYAEALAIEIQSKTISTKRRLAADLYGDGTGVIGEVASIDETNIGSGEITITLDSTNGALGHVGFFEFDDLYLGFQNDGSQRAVTQTGSAFYAYKLKSKDRANNQVVLQLVNSSLAPITSVSASNLVAGDLFYRSFNPAAPEGQPTIPDRSSISDFGNITEVIPGLESLVANDGRSVHGITMSGSTAGTIFDAGNNALDVSQVQALMDQVKINVGQSSYKWSKMCASPEAIAAFIESRETDRRFYSIEDGKRGTKQFGYQHGQDFLEATTSEYVPPKRLYCLPDSNRGRAVLEAHMSDFTPIKAPMAGEFHLKPSTSGAGYENNIVSFMKAMGTLVCMHPAAVGRLENFTS